MLNFSFRSSEPPKTHVIDLPGQVPLYTKNRKNDLLDFLAKRGVRMVFKGMKWRSLDTDIVVVPCSGNFRITNLIDIQ